MEVVLVLDLLLDLLDGVGEAHIDVQSLSVQLLQYDLHFYYSIANID